jgi:hypothetical protein
MPKAVLRFNLDDFSEEKAFKRAVKSTDAYLVLHSIANEIFRPARKHGYSGNEFLNKLIENSPDVVDEDGVESNLATSVVGSLESMFYEILERYDVNLDDLE